MVLLYIYHVMLAGILGIHCDIITVSEVSVRKGGSVSIPCYYEPLYQNHVKYLCKGYFWVSCSAVIKTNQLKTSEKFSVSDDTNQRIFTVTINDLTVDDKNFWCAIEIDKGKDVKQYFWLSVSTVYSLTGMAARLIVLLLFSGLKGVHSITTVSKVSVKAGKSVSIPCLYDSRYMNHVKYLCKGSYWTSCSYAVKTNEPDRSGKYSISDDKKQKIFTVTINQLKNENTAYWCAVEIDRREDDRKYFQLSVTSRTPSLYVDQQHITGYIGENITIRCHHRNSGGIKWCRLGRNCVTGSSGSIDGTTVTTHMTEKNVFTVTMSGLKPEDSGWYWCAKGDIQIPVHLTVTEKLITRVHNITTVSKVSVRAGKSVSIPCLYESRYMNYVKYLCEGYHENRCKYIVKTNKPDRSGKYSISDDKKQKIFTVTINQLTNKNTDYWCVVEINGGSDHGESFQLSVSSGTPSLYVDQQQITGYIGENITIRCHHRNSGGMKWCRLGRNCVTGSSGSINGTTVTTHMTEPNVFTVTMSGLKPEDSGWYWCAEGDIQIPVHLNVTEKLITRVHNITTVSKVSVTAGKSVSIPCLYESRYINHVKYLCEGYHENSCKYIVKTNEPDRSGKYSISDDNKQKIFTVTINQLTNKNTDYWCVVEINGGSDHGESFQLSVTSGTPSLYVDHQHITGYIGESITIRCHHRNSGGMKWCRLGRNCVTGSSESIDGTTVTTHMTEPNVFTVTMSGLKPEDSGWYWCAEGDIQIPVHLTVTEKLITTTDHVLTGTTVTLKNEQQRASFDPKILIIPLSVLILIVIVVLIIWLLLRHKQSKAESSATAMAGEDVTYSEVRVKKRSSDKVDKEVTHSNVGNMRQTPAKSFPESDREIIYSSVVFIKNKLYSLTGMAAHLIILLLFSGLKGVQSLTTVSKVSVTAGKSVSIPCLYDSQYMNHVKYLCEGYYWTFCSYAVKTNKPDRSGKYSISDDKNQKIFTVTINQLTNENTAYWCAVEIDGEEDDRKYFQLSVTSRTPSLYVDHQQITGYIGENINIRCHHRNSGGMKWCRLGRKCVTGSSGSINGTTVTTHMTEPNVFTVTMSGLKPEDSGWYWCDEGDIQIPVHLTVTEKLITTTSCTTTHTVTGNEQHRASFDPKILIIPLSVLILIVIVVLIIWLILRHKQSKAESSATAMAGEEVTYSEVRAKKRSSAKMSFAETDVDSTYSSVVTMKKQSMKGGEEKDTDVTYSTGAAYS
ncbi:uncharacterized protein LOC115793584 [Archocentrus centrarchus]|uniref:uncharacterized protein LOC115793584 n=1 Tax=Archocentrus centrarchus TaxID=63155 RepID=UPI0011E9E0EF|nr:uncharacterized protein LOC115793584 [Archocentrus centrarchus]